MSNQERNTLELEVGLDNHCFTVMSELIADTVEHIRIKNENPEAITGISTCFPSLDHYTSGLQRGDLIVVAGRPSMGERFFVRDIALYVALVNALPVAMMSADSSGEYQSMGMLAVMAKMSSYSLRNSQMSSGEFERFTKAVGKLMHTPIYFSSLIPVPVQELGEELRKLNKEAQNLGLVVVDCLPELRLIGETMSDDHAIKIAHTSRYLKALAKELDVPIIVISPIERDLEARSSKRPLLTDLPGMAAIANAADLVLFVYRDEVYDPDAEEKGTAQIIVSMNRNGPIGSFSLKYDGLCGSFEEMDHGV